MTRRWRAVAAAIAVFVAACDRQTTAPPADESLASTTRPPAVSTTESSTSEPRVVELGWIIKQGPRYDELWLVREDGTGAVQFQPPLSEGYPWHPDWAPDGTQIVFEALTPGKAPTALYVANADGSSMRQIVECRAPCGWAANPAWSPDGTKIAYWTADEGSLLQSIIIVDVTSGHLELKMTPPEMHWPVAPRWSPDGTKLVVEIEHYRPLAGDEAEKVASWIAVVDLTSASPSFDPLTPTDMWAKYPDWSADGTTISFAAGNPDPFSHRGEPEDLYTVPASGGPVTQLTHQGAQDPWIGTPSWEPDGFLLSLIHSGSEYRIGTADVDGSHIVELRDELGEPVGGAHPRLAAVYATGT
jgi:Tol biopolymer transport system component